MFAREHEEIAHRQAPNCRSVFLTALLTPYLQRVSLTDSNVLRPDCRAAASSQERSPTTVGGFVQIAIPLTHPRMRAVRLPRLTGLAVMNHPRFATLLLFPLQSQARVFQVS
jgi:hypothetical protein